MVFSSANSLFLGAKSPFFSHLSRWIIAFLKKKVGFLPLFPRFLVAETRKAYHSFVGIRKCKNFFLIKKLPQLWRSTLQHNLCCAFH